MTETLIFICAGTMAAATPILFAAMGELVVERTGVLNLSIEGMMATGAAAAFAVATVYESSLLGFAVATLSAGLLSVVFATLTLIFLANQVAAGLAVGILGLGVSALIGKKHEGFTIEPLKSVDWGFLTEIPVVGRILFQHDLVLYAGILLIAIVWFVLTRTKIGLIIKAVGEAPEAAHATGYPVILIRFLAVFFGGAMAGLGGAYLTLAYTPLWAEGLVAGRGWIAVALVVFGSWRAQRVALGAYLFGAISLLELSIQGLGLAIPSQALSAAPYVMTIVILVLISRDARQIRLNSPASLGVTYRHQG